MSRETFKRRLIYFFLSLPYFLLLAKIGSIGGTDADELLWALENTFAQAALSSCFAVVGGFFLALGWAHFRVAVKSPYLQKLTEWLLLAPSFLPPIYILLVGFSLVSFPRGVIGIGLVHGFINAGLLALGFEKVFRSQLGGLSDMAYVAGASKFLFWLNAFRLVRADLLFAFLFVFSMAIGSFSVPLMIGGGDGTTLEVLIYEKIRISNAWDEALFLSLLQWSLIIVISFFSTWGKSLGNTFEPALGQAMKSSSLQSGSLLLRSRFCAILMLAITYGFAGFYFYESIHGWFRVLEMDGLLRLALDRILVSSALIAGAYLLFYFSFYSLGRLFGDHRLRQGLNQFIAPSSSLVAFALLFFVSSPILKLLAFVLGCFWIFFPVIYKMRWTSRMNELEPQIQMARVMGASDQLIFKRILWPQVFDVVHLLCLIGSVFVAGDFAFSKIFLDGHETLALLIESLMSSYRTEAGIALSLGLLLLPVLVSSILKVGVLKHVDYYKHS